MKNTTLAIIGVSMVTLTGCMQNTTSGSGDTCGASHYQNLVGGPSSAVRTLDIPGDTRHYGSDERVATHVTSRLNFVHSGTAFESVTNPDSTIIRVFCG